MSSAQRARVKTVAGLGASVTIRRLVTRRRVSILHKPMGIHQDLKKLPRLLEQRETETTSLIGLLSGKRQTIPFEAELHEIRRAKTALAADAQVPGNELRRYLEVRERELRETINEITGDLDGVHGELAEIDKVKAAIGLAPSTVLSAASRAGEKPAKWERVAQAAGIPYQSLAHY